MAKETIIQSGCDQAETGRRIGIRRVSLGLTMEDVAKQIGVAKSTIQRYEAGEIVHLKMPVITSIAFVLRVNPEWLVGKADTPEYNLSEVTRKEQMCVLFDKLTEEEQIFTIRQLQGIVEGR